MAPRPPSLPTSLFLLSTLLHYTTSICVPRNPSTIYLSPSPTKPHPSRAATTPSTSAPQIPEDIHTAVSAMCNRTTYPDLCRSSVRPHLQGVDGSVDLEDVLEMHLKTGRSQTVAAWEEFDALARREGPSKASTPYVKTLEGCKRRYNESVYAYDKALRALPEEDMATVEINLDAVLQGYEGCGSDDAPEDPEGDAEGPWTRHNEALKKHTDNCFDLAKFLK